MFGSVIAKLPPNAGVLKTICPAITTVRHGHRIRGKPVGVAKTIEQRLKCKCSAILRLGLTLDIALLKLIIVNNFL